MCVPSGAALIPPTEHKQIVSASFFFPRRHFYLQVCLSFSRSPLLLSLSLFLSLPSHSFSFHTSHSPCPFLLPCLSGYDDWGFSCSHLVEFLRTFVCVIARACAYALTYVCVCVSPLSAEPCPCPCLLAARSHPAADL